MAVPPKRTRRTKEQIAADYKAKEEADYQAQKAAEVVADEDPLLDGGSSPKQNETFSEPVAVPAGAGDDLDLGTAY